MSRSEYMTLGEAQRALGVSRPTLTKMVREGTLPAVTNLIDKRSKLVHRADVEALTRRGKPEHAPRKNAV